MLSVEVVRAVLLDNTSPVKEIKNKFSAKDIINFLSKSRLKNNFLRLADFENIDVKKYLTNSDFYLSASVSEGMSNSLLEAMALGIPALVSNVSGIEEIIIDNKNGYIFEPLDEKGLYEKLINAITCSKKNYIKLSRLASEHILQNFSINQISDKHIKLYNNLLKNN